MQSTRITAVLWPILLGGWLGCASADPRAELDDGARQTYLQGLRQLYLQDDDRQALLAHCNALLSTYALRAGYQFGPQARRDLSYRLLTGQPGELLVREEQRVPGAVERAVSTRRVSVFGIDPTVHYQCPQPGSRCTLGLPGEASALLTIVRDPEGAAELSRGLTYLIRSLQKS